MTVTEFLNSLRDPYETKARVFPGLLVALPLLVPILLIFGPKNPVLTALLSLFGGCGAIYWLAPQPTIASGVPAVVGGIEYLSEPGAG